MQYRHLIENAPTDPDLLWGMSHSELEALANSRLALDEQARLNALLGEQKEHPLSDEQSRDVDYLLAQVDQLTILKTRARYTLARAF